MATEMGLGQGAGLQIGTSPYDRWIESTGVPVHTGYSIEDLRTLPLAAWQERECNAAFLQLAGQEGFTEGRVTEIPPGRTLPPLRFSLDELVYVVQGRGLATIWAQEQPKVTFEWQKHSLFLLPRGYTHQLSNAQGESAARLLHYNYLPLAMSITPDPGFYFDNAYVELDLVYGEESSFYSEAKAVRLSGAQAPEHDVWFGNFFPDMRAWDRFHAMRGRGAGGHSVSIQFPNSTMWSHMAMFPERRYKKAHRHGPGVLIVVPGGEGYSIMWPEGRDKEVIPWHEASAFVPPDRWFHQHFNVGAEPARYLALHAPRNVARRAERIEDRARDQIDYPDEDPRVRELFEGELTKRGLISRMPEEAYQTRDFQWPYGEDE